MAILVVGSVALDSVETPSGKVTEVLGGSATYFALAASFFSRVRLLSVVGTDFPARYIRLLKKRKVDLSGLQVHPGPTFRWSGRYGENLNEAETVSVSQNVLEIFPEVPAHYRDSEFVFLGNTDPGTQLKVLAMLRSPRLVVCDTMNLWITTRLAELKTLAGKVDILLLNDSEARMLTGQNSVVTAARSLLRDGIRMVIVKKGEHGVLLADRRRMFSIPAYPLEEILDPTGAGDSFGGGFMGYLATRRTMSQAHLRKAVVYGSVLASFAVEDFSTRRLETLTRKDIEKRYASVRNLVTF